MLTEVIIPISTGEASVDRVFYAIIFYPFCRAITRFAALNGNGLASSFSFGTGKIGRDDRMMINMIIQRGGWNVQSSFKSSLQIA